MKDLDQYEKEAESKIDKWPTEQWNNPNSIAVKYMGEFNNFKKEMGPYIKFHSEIFNRSTVFSEKEI